VGAKRGEYLLPVDTDASSEDRLAETAISGSEFNQVLQLLPARKLTVIFDACIDLWIYSAGDIASAKVGDMAENDWQRLADANLTGPFIATRHSLPLLAEDAHLIYLGAVSERLRPPGLAAYAAAKAGLEAFAEALAKEERKRRITVVRPGAVETALWEKVPMRLPKGAMSPQALAVKILDAHAAGHKGTLDL